MNEYVGPLPKDDDIIKMREDLENFLKWMEGPITTVLRARPSDLAKLANLSNGDNGRERGEGGGGGGGPARPTEREALDGADQAKVLREHQQHIRYLLGLVHSNAGDAMDRTNTALNLITPAAKPKVVDGSMCAELYCEDPSDGRQGRCNACYQWRWQWAKDKNDQIGSPAYSSSSAPQVPREVIDARVKARENRKVHVNGPLVGT